MQVIELDKKAAERQLNVISAEFEQWRNRLITIAHTLKRDTHYTVAIESQDTFLSIVLNGVMHDFLKGHKGHPEQMKRLYNNMANLYFEGAA
jgi:hypothetical protein